MKSFGIYTLGNDVVYDQLVALVNSIERNVGKTIPICIIPFDDNSRKTRQFVASRPQLSLYDNAASIARWENFATTVWAAHPQSRTPAKQLAQSPSSQVVQAMSAITQNVRF